jgi:hypothetical protein
VPAIYFVGYSENPLSGFAFIVVLDKGIAAGVLQVNRFQLNLCLSR